MQPTILLVDDEEEILDFLERLLNPDFRILRAEQTKEALEILGKESVQLIISDVMMPGADGFEFCSIIKSTAAISHIPVILLTAKNTLQSKITGLELKADAYIEKPFSQDHLIAQITSLIANREIILNYISKSPLAHIKSMTHSKADIIFLQLLNDIVCEHLEDEKLDVRKLARILKMSRSSLYRKINDISKYSPNELINMIKLQKAAEILSEGSYKVYEVALMLGYSSQSNFARDFHRQFNVTPTEFMETLKRNN